MKLETGFKLPPLSKMITQAKINQYAKASGDFNPIHIDEKFAYSTQFGSTIAHGMLVGAYVSELMAMSFGFHWHKTGKLKLRFKAPVFPGDNLTILGEIKSIAKTSSGSEVTCTIIVSRQTGQDVIAAESKVTVEGKKHD